MDKSIQFTVSEEFDSERLDCLIARLVDDIPSRSFANKLIQNKLVHINEKLVKPSYKVKVNQIIKINTSFLAEINAEPLGEKIHLDILFEDKDILVINKPAGMVVHPGAGVHSGTLVNAVLAHCGMTLPSLGKATRAGIVHRLDRDTSGVLVVAKSQVALTNLSKQFANHAQERIYHTIVFGEPTSPSRKIETLHGRDPKNRIKYAVKNDGVGKKAILNYKTLCTNESKMFSLVQCELFTGRTHQIRVQMSWIGHSILGDALYGQTPQAIKNDKKLCSLIFKKATRQMLHALRLSFVHPTKLEKMSFLAPYPKDFKELLQILNLKVS